MKLTGYCKKDTMQFYIRKGKLIKIGRLHILIGYSPRHGDREISQIKIGENF